MQHALNNLRQLLREWAAGLGLPAFWRWWTAELAPLLPAAPRSALRRRRARPVLVFDGGTAVLWEPRATNGSLTLAEAGRISLGGEPAAIANSGRALFEALSRRTAANAPAKVLIALPRTQVLRKQFTFPAAIEENLQEALAFDLDRHTPFRADQLYFDAVVIGRDAANRQIRVDWTAALKTTVDAARRHAESWGAVVVGVTPDAPASDAGPVVPLVRWSKLNLLPEDERPESNGWRRPQVLVPAALAGAALLAAILLPIWQKRDQVMALTEATEQARAQATASDALRQQLDQASGDYNFVLGRKYAYPSTIKLLDDVTRLLPDDTWLTQFEIKNMPKGKEPHREIMLRGESANAGRLISALEDSKLFEQAAPRSPTTKIQPGPGEVFDLGAQLKSLPPPELIQLASVPRAAPPATAAQPAAAAGAAPVPAAGAAGATVGTAVAPQATPPAAATPPNAAAPAVPGSPAAAAPAPPAVQPSTAQPPQQGATAPPPIGGRFGQRAGGAVPGAAGARSVFNPGGAPRPTPAQPNGGTVVAPDATAAPAPADASAAQDEPAPAEPAPAESNQ